MFCVLGCPIDHVRRLISTVLTVRKIKSTRPVVSLTATVSN
jgi:hypothetical protein